MIFEFFNQKKEIYPNQEKRKNKNHDLDILNRVWHISIFNYPTNKKNKIFNYSVNYHHFPIKIVECNKLKIMIFKLKIRESNISRSIHINSLIIKSFINAMKNSKIFKKKENKKITYNINSIKRLLPIGAKMRQQ